ncbi:MAG: histidine phosphatase family protein, partial [Bacteroidales bacterium]|nr:histidine phosphatase family protein [Bacteroidales bacterium]
MQTDFLDLILVRHAKSDWNNNLRDHDRPLNKRGRNDAPFMGKIIADKFGEIDLILSSSAVRAYITAEIFADELNYKKQIQVEPNLYLTGTREFLRALEKYGKSNKSVMVFAHNPGISQFANYLCHKFTNGMPTAAIAHFQIPVDAWNMITQNSAILKEYLYPKM